MMRTIDQVAAGFVALIGVVHLAVGHPALIHPTQRGVWFLSAGFLLVLTGLANFTRARAHAPSRLQSFTAFSGAAAILILGGLIAVASAGLLFEPQTIALLTLGLLLAGFSLHDLLRRL